MSAAPCLAGVVALALTVPPPEIHTSLAPAAVVQAVAPELAEAGFDVTTADAASGVLTAKRERGPKANADYLRCKWAKNSVMDRHATTTLTVAVVARASTHGGSVVTTTSRAVARFPSLHGTAMALTDDERRCRSNGKAEQAIAVALAPDSTADR